MDCSHYQCRNIQENESGITGLRHEYCDAGSTNPKIVGYIGISTPIDLIDNGIWKFEITKNIEVFHDAYYDFHEYTIRNGCNTNVCEKTKVESLGSVMDFISSNKPYFLAVKKLKRNLLLKMGLI